MGKNKYKNSTEVLPVVSQQSVNVRISPVSVQRVKQDIGRWRMAIREAENITNPQRYLMQQMYLDTVLNGHVSACLDRRYGNVLKKELCVYNLKGEEDEKLSELYNQKWMYDIVKFILDAKMYGYTLIQLGDMEDYNFKEVYQIRRANINPDREIVTENIYDTNGIDIHNSEYSDSLIYVKSPNDVGLAANWGRCGYGLLYKVAPYEIWYKQAVTLWNEYQQLFGMPIRIGKTNTKDESMRSQMAEMLQNMGSAAWGVFDTDDKIEMVNAINTGGNQVYGDMIKKAEQIISKVLLGHSDAIDQQPGKLGASQGSESPTEQAMEDIEVFDCKFVEHELNTNVIPKLVKIGFPFPKGYKICFENNHEEQEMLERENANNKLVSDYVKTLVDAGFKPSAEWLMERTQIPLEEIEPTAVVDAKKKQSVANVLKNKLDLYYAEGCAHE
jgi:phage gp29-like protein